MASATARLYVNAQQAYHCFRFLSSRLWNSIIPQEHKLTKEDS